MPNDHSTAPLAAHRAFRVASVDVLCQTVQSRLAATCLEMPAKKPIDAWANHYKMAMSEFWFCSYGDPVTLGFAESDYVRVQFPYAGAGETRCGRVNSQLRPGNACISSAAATIKFGPGYQQLVWRVERNVLSRKLAAVTGRPVPHLLEFKPDLSLSGPQSGELLGILDCLLKSVPNPDRGTNRFLTAELEQALIVSLLTGGEHNCSRMLEEHPLPAASWQVRRVEEYIEANWDTPFDVEDIALLTGASTRTIYRQFRRSRGYGPMEFAKRVRLGKAREMLQVKDPVLTVTDVAFACGFSDLSHFSRDFHRAFGATPSSVLRSKT